MSWQLHIPYRSRDDSLLDVIDMTAQIPDAEDRATTRALATDAFLKDRLQSAGELLDRVRRADEDRDTGKSAPVRSHPVRRAGWKREDLLPLPGSNLGSA